MQLSQGYEAEYAALLQAIADVGALKNSELALFWPKVGLKYAGELLLIGRAVNGWIDRWVPGEDTEPSELARIARNTGEGTVNVDQLGWVLDRWKPRDGGYDTSTSQFWETTRRVLAGIAPGKPDWPSHIAWTNLMKVAPWHGGNPGSKLLALQRQLAPALLEQEIQELKPRAVIAMTGRWWFEPFAERLGVAMEWRDGLVEGTGHAMGATFVVSVHPMTRSPAAVATAISACLSSRNG